MGRLAPSLRFPVTGSRGRRFPEREHPYRNPFQRDRDRIVHARAFRRLEDKTQVFPPDLSDHFRNRLTHTIEVAQIARTAANVLGLDEDLTEALALAHDIGHPPFAHAGEQELDRQMQRFGERFDHNLHALRIVESFEQRYAGFPGLNLTFEVREGIVKHSREIAPGETGGLEEYLPGLRPPLEAQLIDLADEIAYNTADLDDAYSAGFFTLDEAAAEIAGFRDAAAEVAREHAGAGERIRFHEILRRLIDRLVTGLIEGTVQAVEEARVRDVEDVRCHPCRLVRMTPESGALARELKSFLRRRVYESPPVLQERQRSVAAVAALFEYYLEDPARLPQPYARLAESGAPHRVICDYIAGMTDGFLRRTCQRLGL
ncbi:MAG: dNTP triphosphohydrolase [Bryobacterales bacterium]|nr:dNTP triphosphohydrolase [Bryobacteraceae bacterium]MDW8129615.1 dNTP triphosphohydrolase [Bryobacterales bacterium]